MSNREETGLLIPEILIPEEKVNLKKWAVVACDQFTSQPEYWEDVDHYVGNAPSTLHMILPEAMLDSQDKLERISHCKETMRNYIEDGILVKLPRGMVYVEREVGPNPRRGIIAAIDLEKYDFLPETNPLIKATEETVLNRIPPRVGLRRNAALELPHTVLLIDDPKDTVIGPIAYKKDQFYSLYDFDLMEDGGNISGYFVEKEEDINAMLDAVAALIIPGKTLFAVGDGNHSLVTAKAIWEEAKETLSSEEINDHPLRYTLVEIVNLYDPAIDFKPINRIIKNVEPNKFISDLMAVLRKKGCSTKLMYSRSNSRAPMPNGHNISFVMKDTMGRIEVSYSKNDLQVALLQEALDECVSKDDRIVMDYIHGEPLFNDLCRQYSTIGFKVPTIDKKDLFALLGKYGLLPRKTFSIGDSNEKRYYLECRLITRDISEFDEREDEDFEDDHTRRETVDLDTREDDFFENEEDFFEDDDEYSPPSKRRGLFSRKNQDDEEDLFFEDEGFFEDEEEGFEETGKPDTSLKSRLFGIKGKGK